MDKVKPENWEEVKKIFNEAMRLPVGSRESFLKHSCGKDENLRREVESLLASYNEADSFLEKPLIGNSSDSAVTEQLHFQNGAKFAQYEVIRQIGSGGMGEVYLAQDTKLGRKVAIKILNEKFAQHESNLQRFIQEARSASALNHPNILTIFEIGEAENTHFIVSEYIEGETLRELLQKKSLLLADVLDIAVQLANALSAAHSAKIVHRDIKPENIIVRPDGFVKILDFGLAKLVEQNPIGVEESTVRQNETAKGIILGTVNYMSPEQAKGEKVDERTDIFSFGALLYEMLTGRTPFAGGSTSETFANLINKEPLSLSYFVPDVSAELEIIVSKALKKNRDQRYQTIRDLSVDLKNLLENSTARRHPEKSNSSKSGNETAVLPNETNNTKTQELKSNNTFTEKLGDRKSLTVTVLIIFAGLIGLLGYYFWSPTGTASKTNVKKTLAVLPFVNSSQDPNAEYLSDGIAESVINRLSQISNLRVMSRNSAFRFKENQTDTKNIASQLGVENLVTGSIKQIGDKFVINVRLIDTKDDSTVWGNEYIKTSTDVIATQNEIAQAVVNNLRLKLTNNEQEELKKQQTNNPQAYEFYLRGRFHFFKTTEPELRKSIEFFQQAIELDPNYALAYAGMGEAYRTLPVAGYAASKEAFSQAKAAAEKALEIVPDLAEAHIVLGWTAFNYDWNWDLAEKELKKAVELAPDNSDAHRAYGHLFSILGKHEQAIDEIKIARELAPLTLINISLEGQFLFYGGRNEEAITAYRKGLEIDPNYWGIHNGLGRTFIKQGRYAEAIPALEKARQLSLEAAEPITQLGYAQAKSGNHEKALQIIEELKNLSQRRFIPNYAFAMIHNGLGERDKALNYLEKSFQEREVQITFINIDTRWNDLRREPRFQDIIRRLGLESNSSDTSSKFYWQMSDAEQLTFIQERARHIETLIGDEPTKPDENALRAIKSEIDDYVKDKDSLSQKPFEEGLRVIYGRASQYVPMIIRAYEARKVAPALGIYQAMIESQYHDCHTSRIGTVGLFLFNPATARKYGLTEKDFCNVEKQADAAARYMSDLSSDFGDEKSSATLGLLGFNIGENEVRNYLRQLRERGISERSFWAILRSERDLKPSLSDDGKQYVPRFFAAAIIGETPESFELSTAPLTSMRERGK